MTTILLFAILICCPMTHTRVGAVEKRLKDVDDGEKPDVIPFPGPRTLACFLLTFSSFILQPSAFSAEPATDPPLQVMALQPDTRSWFRNPDGSCVQCSIGMAGVHCNDLNAATLLWDSPYGPAVRGGSWPKRVEDYCDQRHIKVYSVTGATVDDTVPWMQWAANTGRFAAVGCGTAHFQTLYGYDARTREWYVCNNNSTQKVDRYSDQQFRQLHAASGPWCVILERPSSPPPQFVKWFK